MEPWGTHFIAFLFGTVTGAAGSYFASKYTDRRREKEDTKKVETVFQRVKEMMPDLIQEMKTDFSNPDCLSVREFVILSNNKVGFRGDKARFVYFEEEHYDLRGKASVLENHGFIYDVSRGHAPTYRVTEQFWDLVRNA